MTAERLDHCLPTDVDTADLGESHDPTAPSSDAGWSIARLPLRNFIGALVVHETGRWLIERHG